MKRCSACKEKKCETEFNKNRSQRDGLCNECRECQRKRGVAYNKSNKEKVKESSRKYYLKNKEQAYEKHLRWKSENLEKYRLSVRLSKRRQLQNPVHRLCNSMRSYIYHSLTDGKNGFAWQRLVGYTVDELRKHLEKQFRPGMSWDNYGEWHIDHIIPVSAFYYESYENVDFKRCWSLNNLRPLWRKENISKGNKITSPFQPYLNMTM